MRNELKSDLVLQFGISDYKTSKFLFGLWQNGFEGLTVENSDEKIRMYGFDPARISYLLLELDENDVVYFVGGLKGKKDNFYFGHLERFFSRVGKKGFVLGVHKKSYTLNLPKGNYTRSFSVYRDASLDTNFMFVERPIDTDILFTIPTEDFKVFINDSAKLTDYLTIVADKELNRLFFRTAVEKVQDHNIVVSSDYVTNYHNYTIDKIKTSGSNIYSIDFLEGFISRVPSKTIQIGFNIGEPMKIIVPLLENSQAIFYLAPRIEEAEEEEIDYKLIWGKR